MIRAGENAIRNETQAITTMNELTASRQLGQVTLRSSDSVSIRRSAYFGS